jgi:hypothetical protein
MYIDTEIHSPIQNSSVKFYSATNDYFRKLLNEQLWIWIVRNSLVNPPIRELIYIVSNIKFKNRHGRSMIIFKNIHTKDIRISNLSQRDRLLIILK